MTSYPLYDTIPDLQPLHAHDGAQNSQNYERVKAYEIPQNYERVQAYEKSQMYERAQIYEKAQTYERINHCDVQLVNDAKTKKDELTSKEVS